MKIQKKVVFIFLMVLIHQIHLVVLLNSTQNELKNEEKKANSRKLVNKKQKSKKSETTKKEKVTKTKKAKKIKKSKKAKQSKRKLYYEDYKKHLGTINEYSDNYKVDQITKYITVALASLLLIRNINGTTKTVRRERRMNLFQQQTEKLGKMLKGKNIYKFAQSQKTKLKNFLIRRNRKLQGQSSMSSIVKMGQDYISKELGIPKVLMMMFTHLTKKFLNSFSSPD